MSLQSASRYLPEDLDRALLVGRVWRAAPHEGPAIVAIRQGEVVDLSRHVETIADLLEHPEAAGLVASAEGESLGRVETLIENSLAEPPKMPYLLAPCDVQAIKACGVTFAVSMLERVIEEQAGGDAARAGELRQELQGLIGTDLSLIKPGSDEAMTLKAELQTRGGWSQYMEVGIGIDAEVFTKSQPLSAVGFGQRVGLHPASKWNNPEPEIVLAVDGSGQVRGATLGNDVNLRDIEGRSALLLGKAKDNNASCSVGPFIRLFDEHFTIDTVRQAHVTLRIDGEDDGFLLEDGSDMRQISRDPLDLVAQTHGAHHQYPDGFMLFLGTMFSPILDRDGEGQGFTHHIGDTVTIATPALGALVNRVDRSDKLPPWTFGIRQLYRHLAQRKAAE
ncbi:fumarylacetoacetate hydrolase family protein [Halomonas sp. McH1-25]|uniref:fumarylacetoacetate hydrolase family protein n=1 Tax=unclassified Halomonas TaxID=2609666 RepID=UPI001EF47334|nr:MULTISPECIES: fumarylacetoacetate hydrolase family protein [unclassified Halomonas]MCG7600029.1 fumarylacetoacetate hydrolase family protein [Halomonas sp. McH1-25]MCP1344124.1 fumarylacetoacetate hydrolase family protein [Halomonas sp. FL8]MCP1362239.1 fumarylacetoacetate hydrolase family protein [Halomonas sp. BBD45]MCP1367171.1 fumarylacetoacetate hydrolase family protein [Halomonas sp. BBD48]